MYYSVGDIYTVEPVYYDHHETNQIKCHLGPQLHVGMDYTGVLILNCPH